MTFNCQYWNSRHWNDQCRLKSMEQPDDTITFGKCTIHNPSCCASCGGSLPVNTESIDYWNPATREVFIENRATGHGQNLLGTKWRKKTFVMSGYLLVCNKCELETVIDRLKACLRCENQTISVKRCGEIRQMQGTWIETQSTFSVQESSNITYIDYTLTFVNTDDTPFFKRPTYKAYDFVGATAQSLNFGISAEGTAPAEPEITVVFYGTCDQFSVEVQNSFKVSVPGPFKPLDIVKIRKAGHRVTVNGVGIRWNGSLEYVEPGASTVDVKFINAVGPYNFSFKYKNSFL